MKPGRELNALVAEKVMGQTPEWREKMRGHCSCGRCETCSVCSWPLPYSTQIAVAWEVVEASNASVFELFANVHTKRWVCKFSGSVEVAGESASHAICLAALKAVGA